MRSVMALFGESEKGQLKIPYFLNDLPQLVDYLGHPPAESEGLFFAVQALLFKRELIYFRVEEEGFSEPEYITGLKYLEEIKTVHALCMPGVGDPEILERTRSLCAKQGSLLITTQKDLYDYLTAI